MRHVKNMIVGVVVVRSSSLTLVQLVELAATRSKGSSKTKKHLDCTYVFWDSSKGNKQELQSIKALQDQILERITKAL